MTTHSLQVSALTLSARHKSTLARASASVARYLLGTTFFVFGLNGFLDFIPAPAEGIPAAAAAFGGALAQTDYMLPLIKGTEVLAGALLLANRWVSFALVLLAPIVVNIVAFHAFLAPGLSIPLLLLALGCFLAWTRRATFASLFR